MAFKNALKMLATRFGLIWVLLLYMLITGVLVASLSIPFAVPVVRAFRNAGVGKQIADFFGSMTGGDGVDVWYDKLYAIVQTMKSSLLGNKWAAFWGGTGVVLVLIIGFRFIFGLYEIPLTDVLEGAMSSNARIGFAGRFVARLGKSGKFVLCKILYTVAFDVVTVLIVFGLFDLFNVQVLKYFAPFLIMAVYLALLALRYSVIAMWAPAVVIGEYGIFRAFGFSAKRTFRYKGSVFCSYLVAWTLIIAINVPIGLFTFGAGLILTVPASLLFINLLNMTVYYGKNGKRYYTDSATVVTPPIADK
ncbi:MAG: hypothetical protein K2L51_03945 [Clostridiales bacterium]|nr:hypothetical protein [Clostridiales bacterium]